VISGNVRGLGVWAFDTGASQHIVDARGVEVLGEFALQK